jgi:hypothetical protein
VRQPVCLLVFSAVLAAQTTAPIRGPFVGYVFDRGAGLRPILGIPGAASIGEPIVANTGIATAAVSAERNYALVIAGDDRSPMLIDTGSAESRAIPDVGPGVDRVVLSPSASAALLYRKDLNRIDVIMGLPGNASLAWSADLTQEPSALAVADDGEEFLAADASSVVRIVRSGDQRHVAGGDTASVAYRPQSREVLIGERSGRLLTVRESNDQVVLFTADRESFGEPIVVSSDRKRAYVASQSRIAIVPLDGGTADIVECACSITTLDRMEGESVFRLNDLGSGPLWLLDDARVVFVPAVGGAQ